MRRLCLLRICRRGLRERRRMEQRILLWRSEFVTGYGFRVRLLVMQSLLSSLLLAPCSLLLAPCSLLLAPYPLLLTLCSLLVALSLALRCEGLWRVRTRVPSVEDLSWSAG
jgi:hypothetical protein